MDGDVTQLRAIVDELRKLDRVGVEIAEASKDEVLAIARESAAAGKTPEGEAWAPTKDGRQALKNAPNAISAVVSGAREAVLTLILSGFYVFHHLARAKHPPRRAILFDPDAGVPPRMSAAVAKHTKHIVGRTMGGR